MAALGYGAPVALATYEPMRSAPSLTADTVGTLPAGQVATIWLDVDAAATGSPIFGPVEADGLTWYPVFLAPLFGWIGMAAADDFVVRPAQCSDPGALTVDVLQAMAPGDRLVCFAGEPLTVSGMVAVTGLGGRVSGSWVPSWLADPSQSTFIVGSSPRIQLRIRQGRGVTLPASTDGLPVMARVRLHVDDPAAGTCEVAGEGATQSEQATAVLLYCRTMVVMEAIEPT
jgi:hypothetical protein